MREIRALSIASFAMLAASARTGAVADDAIDSVIDALVAKALLLPVDHARCGKREPEPVERAYRFGGALAVEYSRFHKVVERSPVVASAGVDAKAHKRFVDDAAEEGFVRFVEQDGSRKASSHEACLFEFVFDLGEGVVIGAGECFGANAAREERRIDDGSADGA